MGTYIYARLKNKDEETIERANRSAQKAGIPTPTYKGILYGFFTSRAMLEEDARFMNEDEEGLTQLPHFKRPITPEMLTKSFFWYEIGCGVIKITGCDDKRQKEVDLVRKWLRSKDARELIDWENSDNIYENNPNPPAKKNYPVKTLPVSYQKSLDNFPNFHKSGSIRGMKKHFYGKDALLIRCGNYIYNVSSQPERYHNI